MISHIHLDNNINQENALKTPKAKIFGANSSRPSTHKSTNQNKSKRPALGNLTNTNSRKTVTQKRSGKNNIQQVCFMNGFYFINFILADLTFLSEQKLLQKEKTSFKVLDLDCPPPETTSRQSYDPYSEKSTFKLLDLDDWEDLKAPTISFPSTWDHLLPRREGGDSILDHEFVEESLSELEDLSFPTDMEAPDLSGFEF